MAWAVKVVLSPGHWKAPSVNELKAGLVPIHTVRTAGCCPPSPGGKAGQRGISGRARQWTQRLSLHPPPEPWLRGAVPSTLNLTPCSAGSVATTSMAGLLLEGHAVVPQRLLAQASPVLLARLFQGILPHPATPEVPPGSLLFPHFPSFPSMPSEGTDLSLVPSLFPVSFHAFCRHRPGAAPVHGERSGVGGLWDPAAPRPVTLLDVTRCRVMQAAAERLVQELLWSYGSSQPACLPCLRCMLAQVKCKLESSGRLCRQLLVRTKLSHKLFSGHRARSSMIARLRCLP